MYDLMKATYKLMFGFGVAVIVAFGGYYAWQSNAGQSGFANLSSSSKLSDAQVSELVTRVGAFLNLPSDEKPSVSLIKDSASLAAQQSFYKDAKDGDVLMIYSTRAIIYDVKANKLVNVGPIIRNDNPPVDGTPIASASATVTPVGSPTPTPKLEAITVDVRNGTGTAGLAGATASTLKKNTLFTIGVLGDAKGSYTATVVVDLTKAGSTKTATVQELAKTLNAKVVAELPKGELASKADALVIVGK